MPTETFEEEDTAEAAGSNDVTPAASAAAPSRAQRTRIAVEYRPKSQAVKTTNQLYDEDGSKATGRAKTRNAARRAPILDPEVCEHRVEWLTTKGSNQYRDKVRCEACNTVISSEETEWWRDTKERRRLQDDAAKAGVARRTTTTGKPITASELRAARAEPRRSAGSAGGTGAPR